jgi:hypothetical protein
MINVSKNLNETHKKYTQRKNLGRNHWEIHGKDSRHG